jgi:hypothetical protein
VKFSSRSYDAVIRVYDETGDVIETHEQLGDFRVVSWLLAAQFGAPRSLVSLAAEGKCR